MLKKIPYVEFQTRVRDESIKGDNPFKWEVKNTNDFFSNKRCVLFSSRSSSLQHVQHFSYLISISFMQILNHLVLTKYIVFQLMILLS